MRTRITAVVLVALVAVGSIYLAVRDKPFRQVSIAWGPGHSVENGRAVRIRYPDLTAIGLDFDHIRVQQTARAVTIAVIYTLHPTRRLSGWIYYPNSAQDGVATIQLASPLGVREVLHAPISHNPVSPPRPPQRPFFE